MASLSSTWAGRAFSAGADAQRDQASGLDKPLSLPQNRDRIEDNLRAFVRIWDLRIPVIAKDTASIPIADRISTSLLTLTWSLRSSIP